MLHMPQAWGISTGSASVKVAILDTGVMSQTPDLAGRVLGALTASGATPLDGTAVHHGTWVASVVGMGVDNGIGGAGVGNFSILPISVTNAAGNNSSDWIAAGIRLAADQGARAINISHGTLKYGPLNEAAAYARTKGALVFVAGGNSDAQRTLLGTYDNLIFVAGTNALDERWSNGGGVGSSWGDYIDLSAPADNILVADPTLGSGYGVGDGTSFAAPFVTGAAALAWSINPGLTADQVQAILYDSVVDLGAPGWDPVFGHGRIDLGMVAAAASVPEPTAVLLLACGALWAARRAKR
jgi:subtilisin family serine protease